MKSWLVGTASSVNSEIITPFSNAEQIIYKYNQAIEHNSLTQQGWKRLIAQCDDGLASYLTNIKGSTASMSAYSVSLQGNITGYTKITQAMKQYNALGAVSQKEQQNFATAVSLTNTKLGSYLTGLNGAKASLSGYSVSLIASTAKTVGLTIATTALNAALTFGISAIITGVVSAFATWINSSKKITEAAEEAKDKISSINDDLKTNTETVENAKQRYAELAQEVENLGQVSQSRGSLSTDEYEEFLDLSNQLAGVFPQLTKGYDDNGNAILNLSGNVNNIVSSLDDLLQKEKELANQKIMDEFPDVYKGYVKDLEDAKSEVESAKKKFDDINSAYSNLDNGQSIQMGFLSNGYNKEGTMSIGQYESWLETLGLTYEETVVQGGKVVSAVGDINDAFTSQLETARENLQYAEQQLEGEKSSIDSYLNTWLQTEFTYNQIDDAGLQTAVQDMIMNFDFSNLPENVDKDNWNEVSEYLRRNILFAINDVQDDPDISKAISEVFTNQDLTPDEKADYLKQIKDYFDNELGKDNAISISLQPQIDDTDALQKSYENTINRFKDSDKIKDFFDTEGINTDEEINEFNEVTKGINDADKAIQTWNEHKKASEETPISFTDALNSSEYADIKEKLLDLAKSGEITAKTLSSTEEYNALLEKVGISAESAKDQILDMLSAQERLAGAAQGLDKLKSAYEEFKNKDIGFVTAETLESLPDVFKNLPDFDLFSKIVGNPESGKEKIQQAFNDIVKSYLVDQETLQGLVNADSATIQTYIANLKQMGITNAEEVVRTANEALNSDNKMINEAEKEYNKYLKGKLKGGEKFLESTASNNSKLKNALGSTYKSDYDNWCDLLSKKADAYNEFVKALGGSYDDSKNVAQNLAANNGSFGANEYAEAQAAYDKWKQTKKQADDLKNSLKLDYSQITTDFGANWSPTTKKSKSKSKTKSDAAEVFDFIEIKLNNLADKASKAKDKIDDLLTFGQKKNQTKKAIEATTKAITAQEKAYKKYMSYADKAAKKQNSKKTTSSSSSSSGGNAVYDTATNYLGLKYVWGGASLTSGADCSGFTQQIYKKFGVSLPHHAADQAKMGTKITSKKNLQAGDLVFFGKNGKVTHVGIYGGDGKFIEEPHSGASARISNLSSHKDYMYGTHFNISGSTTTTSSGSNVKSVKGVSSKTLEHYKSLIRNGTLDADGIQTIKNENLKNALKDYQTWYEKAKACKEQVASLTDQLKDLYETLANNPIDSASDKIEKLGTKMDILNAKVSNLTFDPTKKIGTSDIDGLYKQIIKNYDSQLSASKTAYTGATKSYNSNKSSLTKSLKKTKAKNIGLTQKEFNSIKSNLKSNKSISYNLINKIGNDSLREKCIAHNEYLLAKNTATDNYNQAKEDYTSNVRQARKDRFDKVQERYDNKAGLIEQRKNAVSNSLSIAEAKGQLIGEAYYTRQANAVKSDMKLKQEEAGKLAKKLSTIKFGSNEWYEAQEALNGVYESIQQDEQELAEFQKSINELKFDRFDELLNKLGDITDETDFLIDLLDSDNLFNSDNGSITNDGITAIGLTAQNYDVYLAEAEQYKKQIADLEQMYKNGEIGLTQYNSQMREYQQGMRNSIKSANDAKKAVIDYVKQGLDAQNEALSKSIDKQKELLESEKDLHDFQSKISDQNKNIANLRKQIAALEGDSSESNRKKLQQLKSDLKDAEKEQSDTLYDRSVSDQEKALDDMLTKSQEAAENYLKNTDQVFVDALDYVNKNTSQVSQNLEKIAKDTGYDISTYITNAWKDSGDAVGTYESTLSSNVPKITSQIQLITNAWNAQCEAANKAAKASANAAAGSDETTKDTDKKGNSSSGSGNKSNTSSAKDIKAFIQKSLNKAGQKKSYYGALNRYLYEKTGGKVLSVSEEVQLAKMLGVSVKKDLSGTSDRQKILDALKKKKIAFANGGVLGDLVKLSGEDGLFIGSAGESILTKEQTQALINFRPVIPQLNTMVDLMKNVPISSASQSPTYNIDNRTIVEGVATDQIVKQMEGVAQKQAENVVRKINQATYAKGVRK